MLWAASGLVPSQASNDLVSSLGTCPNGISQPYTTTTHNSTTLVGGGPNLPNANTITTYTDGTCTTPNQSRAIELFGNIPLLGGSFLICPGTGPASLGAFLCSLTGGSARLTHAITNTGTYSVTGSCIAYSCAAGSLTSWILNASSTLAL